MTASASATTAPASLGNTYDYCFRGGVKKRWDLLSAAQRVLTDDGRIQRCHTKLSRDPLSPAGLSRTSVQVWAGEGKAWYRGTIKCGCVWTCPVCSQRIAEGRKIEVQAAIDSAVANGLGVSLITLTVRHGVEMQLTDLLDKFSRAQRRLKSGRAYKQLQADFGLVGEVRALEVTNGANGWHPHTHAIAFSGGPLKGHTLTQLKRRLFVLWYRACDKEGLPLPSYRHGVDVRGARYAGEYVAKWGFASELARPHIKAGKIKNRTAWELLADAGSGDKRAAWLYREFAQCFRGKRQLFWSRGLRERLGVHEEQSDLSLAEREPIEKRLLADVDDSTWCVILRAGARGDVLEAAQRSPAELHGFLNHLRSTIPLYNGCLLGAREDWAA